MTELKIINKCVKVEKVEKDSTVQNNWMSVRNGRGDEWPRRVAENDNIWLGGSSDRSPGGSRDENVELSFDSHQVGRTQEDPQLILDVLEIKLPVLWCSDDIKPAEWTCCFLLLLLLAINSHWSGFYPFCENPEWLRRIRIWHWSLHWCGVKTRWLKFTFEWTEPKEKKKKKKQKKKKIDWEDFYLLRKTLFKQPPCLFFSSSRLLPAHPPFNLPISSVSASPCLPLCIFLNMHPQINPLKPPPHPPPPSNKPLLYNLSFRLLLGLIMLLLPTTTLNQPPLHLHHHHQRTSLLLNNSIPASISGARMAAAHSVLSGSRRFVHSHSGFASWNTARERERDWDGGERTDGRRTRWLPLS